MAYDEHLGVALMVAGHMAVGVDKERLMVRISHEAAAERLKEAHVKPRAFMGRPMKGFLYVEAAGVRTAAGAKKWVTRAAAYATSLPPKKPKARKVTKSKAPPRRKG